MFVRSYFNKGYEYLSLVESRREGHRVWQRTVLYLGRADCVDREVLSALLKRLDAGFLPHRLRAEGKGSG